MKKSLFISLVIAALVGLYALPTVFAAGDPGPKLVKVPEAVKAENQAKKKKDLTKPAITFKHSTHTSADCVVCHHKDKDPKKPGSCSNAGCHDAAGKKAKKDGTPTYYQAFHDKKSEKSCVGCHKAEKKGPVKCTECHVK